MVLSYAQDGAVAVAQVPDVIARLAGFVTASSDADTEGRVSHADKQLANLLNKLPDGAAAQAARDAAADASFEPLLRLKPDSAALKALVRSDRGRARARRALANVLASNVERTAEWKLLLGTLRPCYEEIRSEFDDVGKRLLDLAQRDGLEAS